MGRRRNEGFVDDIVEIIGFLPSPLRPLAAFAVFLAFVIPATQTAVKLLKSTKQPLPWPLDWFDAVVSFRVPTIRLDIGWVVTLCLLIMLALAFAVFRPKTLEERRQARRRLRRELGLPVQFPGAFPDVPPATPQKPRNPFSLWGAYLAKEAQRAVRSRKEAVCRPKDDRDAFEREVRRWD